MGDPDEMLSEEFLNSADNHQKAVHEAARAWQM
jgi:hypothetical protein